VGHDGHGIAPAPQDGARTASGGALGELFALDYDLLLYDVTSVYFEGLAEARDWQAVREGIEAKQCPGPDGVETFVLIRSVERREKERAMHARFARRIEDDLTGSGSVCGGRADRVQAHILVRFLAALPLSARNYDPDPLEL
jgi:hypothetical protein